MPLRCLLFSSDETVREPIWQVLASLGIEGEYCPNAVDAVERVTTQLFQIVITDWEDQPEASFLLKTARDQKAAQRPLTLAIVGNESRLPEALQSGANSVLLKPIRPEQVRDTMSTACELLRAKQTGATAQPVPISGAPDLPAPLKAAAASASVGVSSVRASKPAMGGSERAFRPGEFLQSGTPAPSAQFETESDIKKTMTEAAVSEVEALTELEPMASAVSAEPAAEPAPAPVTGWASLQERLTRAAPQGAAPAPKSDLLSYGEMTAFEPTPTSAARRENREAQEAQSASPDEAALFAYMDGATREEKKPKEPIRPGKGKLYVLALIAAACAVALVVPRTRQGVSVAYTNSAHAGKNWLNPQAAPVQPAATQHETFNDSEEYKLPAAGNIPDATTDPSQIRVVPVIDPTAKPNKNADSNGGQAVSESASSDPSQITAGNAEPGQVVEKPPNEQAATTIGNITANSDSGSAGSVPSIVQAPPTPSVQKAASPPHEAPIVPQTQSTAPQNVAPVPSPAAIPSSLRSQLASVTPEASGAKPVEAAMSAIEPVALPESAAWGLLAQKVDPKYPDAAKSTGARGNIVLQVLIGHDGTVQEAKFLQGSLLFARSAIDAVKQWHFKPYLLNSRPVSVQTTITLNFKPPV
jgi:TonB family protein